MCLHRLWKEQRADCQALSITAKPTELYDDLNETVLDPLYVSKLLG
uniref:Uncharacterized protein n=1 Tax=Peronospora matthiolae TaxID=2874970 RepID=A0AAV1U8L7_9STRA